MSSKPFVPCKDCKDRSVGCHSVCGKYSTYKLQIACARKKQAIQKMADQADLRFRG